MALDNDREIFDVADHTEHVTFQKTTRRTENNFDLPMIVHDRLAYSPEEYVRRYDTIQRSMHELGLDALLLRSQENITYFSGYESPGYYKYHCVQPRSCARFSSAILRMSGCELPTPALAQCKRPWKP